MIIGQIGELNGIKIIINDQNYGKLVIRPWKERLFARPWQPFKKHKEVDAGPVIPDGQVLESTGAWTMNSRTWKEVESAINNQQPLEAK